MKYFFASLISFCFLILVSQLVHAQVTLLGSGWEIQDSRNVVAPMSAISQTSFQTQDWIRTTVPNTVLGSIVENGRLGFDPFFGMNLKMLPGSGSYYVWGENYGSISTPVDSPFGHDWIYRKSFTISRLEDGKYFDLILRGLTYSADVWINGSLVRNKNQIQGSYREFVFDISKFLQVGENVLAVSVSPPIPSDLTANWVDWNHTPQDKNMGLWNEVFLAQHGPVSISHPQVITHLENSKANLIVEVEVENHSSTEEWADVAGEIGSRSFEKNVRLTAGEKQIVRFTSEKFPSLKVNHPELWWPYQMGNPTLHSLHLEAKVRNELSDQTSLQFGIREITSELNTYGSRLFKVNGKPILIRGAGWASDLFLRFSKDRQKKELQYVKDLGLNTIRLEGRFETSSLLDFADQEGILVMTGWVCCNSWQQSSEWTPDNLRIAADSLRDQIYNFRGHPSTLAFLYGSDQAPSEAAEATYYKIFDKFDWPNPIISSAAKSTTQLNGDSGFKMYGPYDYTPPSYWTVDKHFGGAFGFNTETSPGPSIPPIESLRQFIPADHLWPIDDYWKFHAGLADFAQIEKFEAGLANRYGAAAGVDEFALKAQALAYENHRAMFEAFAITKYKPSTGIIQWMLNNAWPSLIWHLYDYYLRPGGAYFGAKKANQLVHLLYGYSDDSVYLTNHTNSQWQNLNYKAEAYDLESKLLFSKSGHIDIDRDSSKFLVKLPQVKLPQTYFLKLTLASSSNTVLDDNFYWLSSQKEIFDWSNTHYYSTPVLQDANLKGLNSLPMSSVSADLDLKPGETHGVAEFKNVSSNIAFLVHYKLMNGDQEILPVLWSDNYISLLPGETRTITFDYSSAGPNRSPLRLVTQGWNSVLTSVAP